MKIVVLTAFHARPHISAIYWQNIKDLGLDVVAIVSDESNEVMANEYAHKVFKYKNQPLGEKLQKGVEFLRDNVEHDYVLFLGSDDLISHKLLNIYKSRIEKYKYIGVSDYLDMSFDTKLFRYFKGYDGTYRAGESLGAGRIVCKEYLEKIDYQVFPVDRHKYMDRVMTDNLYAHGINNKLIKKGIKPYLIGIKDRTAISSKINGCNFEHHVDLNGYFSQEVIKMLYK